MAKRKSNKSQKQTASEAPQSKEPVETPVPMSIADQETADDSMTAMVDKKTLPRVISLIVLLVVVALTGAMFFRVMLQFIVPLFLAGVLVVIFEPVHKWVLNKLNGKPRWSALVTTCLVFLTVLIPITGLSILAVGEVPKVIKAVNDIATPDDGGIGKQILDQLDSLIERYQGLTGQNQADWQEEGQAPAADAKVLLQQSARQIAEEIGKLGLNGAVALIGFFFGLAIMTFALYYFFADGPNMIQAFMRLSPLDDDYERELLEKFAQVSRAVVVATLLSAVVQGLLASIGYYFALDAGAPIFLLTALTILLAIVPFVGAAAVWVPVAVWIFFFQGETNEAGEFVATGHVAAIVLAVYGFAIVSSVDNIIKPLVLHGQSNLHPLLALLSVLGGVSVLGPVGILVGPMLVAFMQALLNMLRKELDSLQHGD